MQLLPGVAARGATVASGAVSPDGGFLDARDPRGLPADSGDKPGAAPSTAGKKNRDPKTTLIFGKVPEDTAGIQRILRERTPNYFFMRNF